MKKVGKQGLRDLRGRLDLIAKGTCIRGKNGDAPDLSSPQIRGVSTLKIPRTKRA